MPSTGVRAGLTDLAHRSLPLAAITAWAIARAGCVISPANPGYSVACVLPSWPSCPSSTFTHSELEHQLKLVNEHYRVKAIFAHPVSLSVALDTAKRIGLSSERVYLIDEVKGTAQLSVNALLRKHSSRKSLPERKKWSRGEGKQRLAIIVRACASLLPCLGVPILPSPPPPARPVRPRPSLCRMRRSSCAHNLPFLKV